jgi:hypothetical protein
MAVEKATTGWRARMAERRQDRRRRRAWRRERRKGSIDPGATAATESSKHGWQPPPRDSGNQGAGGFSGF